MYKGILLHLITLIKPNLNFYLTKQRNFRLLADCFSRLSLEITLDDTLDTKLDENGEKDWDLFDGHFLRVRLLGIKYLTDL